MADNENKAKLNPLDIVGLAANGIKAIGGLIQGIGGRRDQKRLWKSMPTLGVTEGERRNDALYNDLYSQTELPGERQRIEKMNEAVASGVYDAQRSSNSSLGATQAAVDLNSKKISAIQDLSGLFAEYKARNLDRIASWNNQKTALEQQRWDMNTYQPWNIKMNEAVAKKKAGWEAFGGGVDSGLGNLNDVAGTDRFIEMYKALYNK